MQKRPRRKNSIRLKGWNYRSVGYYFLTFCTYQRACLIESKEVIDYLEETWRRIPTWKGMEMFQLDAFVIMPNHVHAILWVTASEIAHDSPKTDKVEPGSASAAVGTFKSTASRQLRLKFGFDPNDKIWQRGFYDRIIRNEQELHAVRKYIELNPVRWAEDRDNLDELIAKMAYHDK